MSTRILYLLTILACVGCQSTKQSSEPLSGSTAEVVTLTVSDDYSFYKIKVQWISHLADGTQDLRTSPRATGKPNTWTTMQVAQIPKDYGVSTKYRVDGELVKVPTGYGTMLKVFVTPQDGKVHAKGVFAANKLKDHFEVPFDGIFELDEPTVIYERKEYFGPEAYTNVMDRVEGDREMLFQ